MIFRLNIFILFIIVSCSSNEKKDLIGNYKSKTYNFIQGIIMQIKGETFVLNSELLIRADSTYIYNTCGNIIDGNWRIYNNDTLVLFCINNKFKNDSLNKTIIGSCGTFPMKYKILMNGELIREYQVPELNKNCIDVFVRK